MNNLLSFCGLVDVSLNASDKDLPVHELIVLFKNVLVRIIILNRDLTCTGKSLSEAFILTSTNPQYDNRLSIDLPAQYMKKTSSEHGENMMGTRMVFCFGIQNNFCTQYVVPMF